MILLDFSGTMFRSISVDMKQNMGMKTDIEYLRHLILNSIRMYNRMFKDTYGEMIICFDYPGGSWRKDIFPYYKARRKKIRVDSGIDWTEIFSSVNIIMDEIKRYLPYKCIRVDKLEADDIIAILAMNAEEISEKDAFGLMKHNVLIVSDDKDYAQLHKFPYVRQYKPSKGNFFKENDPEFALTELILHGDSSDGIPNIFSPEDIFMIEGRRQKSVTTKFIRQFLQEGESCLGDFEKNRFEMNKMLISFDKIPSKYVSEVIDAYKNACVSKNRFELFQYLAQNKLKQILGNIEDF